MESTPRWGGPWLLALLSHLAAGAQAQGSQGPGRDGAEAGGARRQGLGCRMRQQIPQVTDKGGHCWLELSKHPSQCVKNIILQIDSEHVSGSTKVLNEATSRVTKQKRNTDF